VNLDKLRKRIKSGKYQWKKHTLRRLAERGIPQENVAEVIINGEVIEEYSQDKPFHSCLIFGWTAGKPLHVVVSMDEKQDIVYIITVYEPSLDRFKDDYKTRKE